MPSVTPAPDLFDHLVAAYQQWSKTGKVVLNGLEQDLQFEAPKPEENKEPNPFEFFVVFCRAYLKRNPVSTFGQVGPDFGIVLTDGTRLPFARGSSFTVTTPGGSVSMVGQNYFDPLPPAFEIPITGGR